MSFADGHGGIQSIKKLSTNVLADTYRITLADTTTFDFVVTNGRGITGISKTSTSGLVDTYTISYNNGTTSKFTVTNGAKGDNGDNSYVWIKYASRKPSESSHSMGDIPDDWIGIYYGNASSDPSDWKQYKWYKIKGEQGPAGDNTAALEAAEKANAAAANANDAAAAAKEVVYTVMPDVAQLKDDLLNIADIKRNIVDLVTLSNGFMGYDGSGSNVEAWKRFTIPVVSGEKYSFSGSRHMTCYYANEAIKPNVVSGGADVSTDEVREIPSNVNLMTVSFQTSNLENFVIVKSDEIVTKSDLSKINPSPTFNVYSKNEIDGFINDTVYLDVTPSNYRSVLESIADSCFNKRYVLLLSSGEYDIWSMMTDEEKSDSTFKGFLTPKFTKMVGIEKGVVIKCNATTQKSKLSPVNLDVTASIENCKVIASKCRYAIHDDWQERKWYNNSEIVDYWSDAFNKGFERVCRNVETEITDSYVGASWGCGVVNGAKWINENCKIGNGGAFGYICHNDNQIVNPSHVTLKNCRVDGRIRFSSLNKLVKTDCYAHIIGVKANGVNLTEESATDFGAGIIWHIDGYANTFGNSDVTITNTDGLDYSSNIDLI